MESMFYQVCVLRQQRNFLMFLWWPEGDLQGDPREYRMTVHVFGAALSLSIVSFALREAEAASDNLMVSETILRNFKWMIS